MVDACVPLRDVDIIRTRYKHSDDVYHWRKSQLQEPEQSTCTLSLHISVGTTANLFLG